MRTPKPKNVAHLSDAALIELYGKSVWDGRYFVTLRLPGGRIVRRDAARPLPRGRYTILATDNGMQGRPYYRRQRARLVAAGAGRTPGQE